MENKMLVKYLDDDNNKHMIFISNLSDINFLKERFFNRIEIKNYENRGNGLYRYDSQLKNLF